MKRALPAVFSSFLLALGLVVLLPQQTASATTTYTWTGNGDGHAWGQPQNWTPSDATPQDGDSVIIGKNTQINGVPTISLVSLTVEGEERPGVIGPRLVGPTSTITTNLLNWSGRGNIAASLVVNGSAQLTNISPPGPTLDNSATGPGAPPVTLTNNGFVTQSGTFGLLPGPGSAATVVNKGTWLAAGDARISAGNCCSESTGTVENDGTITLAGKLSLDHTRFIAQQNSVVNGAGTLEVFGGLAQLVSPSTVAGGTKLDLASNTIATVGGTTTINGEIQQDHASEIQGTGVFAGSGKYRWLGGTILGDLTLGSNLTGTIEPSAWRRELSSGLGSGILRVEGTMLEKADVLMNGKIVNRGTWHVPTDVHVTVGAGGLGTPPKGFRNAGTIKVDNGAELVLKLLELSNPTDKGVINGGGTVSLSGGIHQFSGGGTVRGPRTILKLVDAAEVHATGTLKLDQARVDIDNAKLWGTFTIGGSGSAFLVRATIVGDLTTGPDVTLFLPVDPGPIFLDGATGDGILRTKGDVRQNHPDAIVLVADAQIVNSGTWLMDQANFDGAGTFINDGKLTVTGSGSATFSFVRFVATGGKVLVRSEATMQFTGLSPKSTDGVIDLAGGRIVTQLPLVLAGGPLGGTLIGKGSIEGGVRNAGVVAPGHGSTRGTISLTGVYRQSSAGTLFLDIFATSCCDKIDAASLLLDGGLDLDRVGTAPLGSTARTFLAGVGPRVGRFDRVSRSSALGAWRVRYTPTTVRLIHL